MMKQEKSHYIIKINTIERNVKIIELVEKTLETEKLVEKVEGNFDVVSELKNVLDKHGLQAEDIEEYIPNVGPGTSFTGTKVGVTIANVVNWALDRKKLEEAYVPKYISEPNIG